MKTPLKTLILSITFVSSVLAFRPSVADNYTIDTAGMHAGIVFKISHLGFSWMWGRFNDFSGSLSYDKANPNASKVRVIVNTASVDTNHSERDKHLRSADFLNVKKYPEAIFTSTSFTANDDNTATLIGNLFINGVNKEVIVDIKKIGEGSDPWGNYRIGFEGQTRIALADFAIPTNLGPASSKLDLIFSFEGIRQ